MTSVYEKHVNERYVYKQSFIVPFSKQFKLDLEILRRNATLRL